MTIGTESVEKYVLAFNREAVLFLEPGHGFFSDKRLENIEHTAACTADKVTVPGNVRIEMLLPVDHADAADLPGLAQLFEIAVNRTAAPVRIYGLERLVDPLCRRVHFCVAHRLINRFSFCLLYTSG